MIVLMMLLGVTLLAGSAWFLLRAGGLPRLRMAAHLADIDSYGTDADAAAEGEGMSATAQLSLIGRLARRLGESASRTVPSLPRLERKELNAAGIYSMEPEVVNGFRLMAGAGAGALALLYSVAAAGGFSALGFVAAV